jgi:methylenetetrahydrofolate--tRNA-(uracil-5-)-methyltransferase
MVPGLQDAEFVRYGVIHRNTYIEAPKVLREDMGVATRPGLYLAGQLTGVEGYVESAAIGIYAGLAAAYAELGRSLRPPPRATAFGSLLAHLLDQTPREFAPMNINWGLFPEPVPPTRDKGVRRAAMLSNARSDFDYWLNETDVQPTG